LKLIKNIFIIINNIFFILGIGDWGFGGLGGGGGGGATPHPTTTPKPPTPQDKKF